MAAFACIFDMDGVLVDNREYHQKAWSLFIGQNSQKQGFDYEALMQQFFGKTNQKIFEYLYDRPVHASELAVLEDKKESIYREIYLDHIQPLPGLLGFLDMLYVDTVKMGIGTSGPMANVDFVLANIGAQKYFSAITDANLVKNGKPDPEVFLKTANKLGVEPSDCIVFEDSFSGVEAGIRAGMTVVGVATEHSKERLIACGAKLAIADFTEMSIPQCSALLLSN